MKPEYHLWHRRITIFGRSILLALSLAALGAPAGSAATAEADPAAACASLADLTNFPITPTEIRSAQFILAGAVSANGVPLPAHCQIDGIINKRIGTDGYPYGDGFEVRLPTPSDWNGRFMFQGGGGTEGSVPPATGTAGTLSPTLAHGWAVASQDGGHENSQLPVPNQFFLDPQAVIDHAYRSIDVTTQTAKYLIKVYYGDVPRAAPFLLGRLLDRRPARHGHVAKFPRLLRRDRSRRPGL